MARDNRKENRQKAKAENENSAPDGRDFSDLLEQDEIEGEEITDGLDTSDDNDDSSDKDDNNAEKSEADGEKKSADTNAVDKEDEEDGKKEEDKSDEAEKDKSDADEKSEDERKAEEDADKAKKDEEPAKKEPEPTSEKEKKEEKKPEDDKTKAPEQLTEEQAAELFTNWRGETQKVLAEHVYRLTDEDVAELNENPAAYIPKAMSRVYLDCISASFEQFVRYLPRMVHQVLEQRDVIGKQETAFYGAWPKLNKPEYRDQVLRLGAAYRQSNPSASQEDFINEVGALAMVALRLSPEAKSNGAGDTNSQQKKEEKPFRPASNAPASSAPSRKTPDNPFAEMAEQFGYDVEEVGDGS